MLQNKLFAVIIECEEVLPPKNQAKHYLLNCTQVAAAATAPTTTTAAAAASAAEPGRGAGGERRQCGGEEEGAVQAPRGLRLPRPRPLPAVRGLIWWSNGDMFVVFSFS